MLIELKKEDSLVQKALNQNSVLDLNATKLQNNLFGRHKKFSCMPALKFLETLSIFYDLRYLIFPLLVSKWLFD